MVGTLVSWLAVAKQWWTKLGEPDKLDLVKIRSLRQLKLPLGVTRLPASAVRDLLKRSDRQPRRNKFGAIRTEVQGKTFDSKAEATRYVELRMLEDAGEIRDLECQPRFPLVVNGIHCGEYRADFGFTDKSGEKIIEDVKSIATKTALYRLKAKLVGALYGVKIVEVYGRPALIIVGL